MANKKTSLHRRFFLLFTGTLLVTVELLMPSNAKAFGDFDEYGIGRQALVSPTEKLPARKINNTPLLIDLEYTDKNATFASPYHSLNSDQKNTFNHTSNEYQTQMGYQFKHVTPKASFNYSPDSYGFGKYYNYELGVAVPIKDVFSLETRYGWNKFDKQAKKGGMEDYQDWSVGVSTTYKGVKLKMDYIDINADNNSSECGNLLPCESKTVFSIIKNF